MSVTHVAGGARRRGKAAIHRKWEKVRVGRKEGRKEGSVHWSVGEAVGRLAAMPMMMVDGY